MANEDPARNRNIFRRLIDMQTTVEIPAKVSRHPFQTSRSSDKIALLGPFV